MSPALRLLHLLLLNRQEAVFCKRAVNVYSHNIAASVDPTCLSPDNSRKREIDLRKGSRAEKEAVRHPTRDVPQSRGRLFSRRRFLVT